MRLQIIILILFVLFGHISNLLSQEQHGDCTYHLAANALPFESANYDDYVVDRSTAITRALENELLAIQDIDKKVRQEIETLYMGRTEYINELLTDEYFLFEDSLNQIVDEIAEQLLSANEIRNEKSVHFLISRSGIPNAVCLGEGTIILYLGLISRLENFDQLAFVMAHELGHHHLNHVNAGMKKRVELMNSDELKARIKASQKQEVRANAKLMELLEGNEISLAKHSRKHELETDALGFEFYKKGGFPIEQAFSALKLLQKLDEAKFPLLPLEEVFNFSDYPWRDHWDDSHLSGLSLIALSDDEKELYSTHPKLKERIVQIKSLGADSVGWTKNELCERSLSYDLEILERNYETGNVFGAFHLAMQLSSVNPENTYVKAILANCLLDFAIARKEHNFSKIAPSPNRKFSEPVNLLATFLDNLSFRELVTISKKYIEANIDLENNIAQMFDLKTKLTIFD